MEKKRFYLTNLTYSIFVPNLISLLPLPKQITPRGVLLSLLLLTLFLFSFFGLWILVLLFSTSHSSSHQCVRIFNACIRKFGAERPDVPVDLRPYNDWEVAAKAIHTSILSLDMKPYLENSPMGQIGVLGSSPPPSNNFGINNGNFNFGGNDTNENDGSLFLRNFTQTSSGVSVTLPGPRSPPKIAFLFLVKSNVPLERVWAKYFKGHEGFYSLYVHSSNPDYRFMDETTETNLFYGRQIPSRPVGWGEVSMIDAERRLLAWALLDVHNMFFVLVSDACIPVRSFPYAYNYLLHSQGSFVDVYVDEGYNGLGRYSELMLPVIEKKNFVKGSQWFALTRKHALLVVADTIFYEKFNRFCRFYEDDRHCIPDEHYVQSFLHIVDPKGIMNYSVTFADWSRLQFHPYTFYGEEISRKTFSFIRTKKHIDRPHAESGHCYYGGKPEPCFLFARKFNQESIEGLLDFPPDVIGF